MKPLGIEKQTLLAALLPILVMAVLLENYFVHSRFADLDEAFMERSQLLAHQLASSSEYAVFSGNTALLQQNLNAVLGQHDVSRVLVLDAAATPLLAGPGTEPGPGPALQAKASASNRVYQDDDALVLYEPIAPTEVKADDIDRESGLAPAPSAMPLGAVIVEVSKRSLIGKKREVLLFSLAATLAILLAALILALNVARRVSRPIQDMSRAMRNFGEGHLDTRIARLPEVLELRELATGFNLMAHNLQHHQAFLEMRVAERTAALAASEQESRAVIENSPDTIARYDSDCRRTYVNPAFCASAGGESTVLLGKKPTELPGGPNAELYETKIREVLETGAGAHMELRWPGADGRTICSNIRLTPECDMSGAVTSVLAVGRDITELYESRDELSRKELAKSRFLAAAGHDLRQPLAAANLFVDALKLTETTPDQDRIIQRLDQTMHTFNELLEALLNISKLDAGVIKPEYRAIDVMEIMHWLEHGFEPLARGKRLGFRLYFSLKEHLIIRSDMDLLKSVLMNLVSNAIKYTREGGVLVSARRRGTDVLFQVWDSGIGIRPEHVGQIFDEFYQIDNPQRDRTSGLGLGLAIGKRAISLLGGDIRCRSRVGRGSVFEFRLPLEASRSRMASQPRPAYALERAEHAWFAQGKRFVVVEDDSLVAEAIISTLTMMEGRVECFHNSDQALRSEAIGDADCYIVDYMTGGSLNGIQFLNRLRERCGKPLAAVLMTGDTSHSFIREAEHCEWPVLHKPVNIAKLISCLREQHGERV